MTMNDLKHFVVYFLAFILGSGFAFGQDELKIALLQMPSNSSLEWNLETGDGYCRKAKSMGADIALFPEMVNIGYQSVDFDEPDAMQKWKSLALEQDDDFIQHFQNLAKELDMAIVITYLEKTDELPKNSSTLIDRHGNAVMTYSKVHTVDPFPMETAVEPGEDFYVADLDTRAGNVKVGIMTCYDREFPESARILMLKGAELILTPNACRLDSLRLMQFQVRAWENSVATAMTSYAKTEGGSGGFNGHSCAFTARGRKILIAGETEGVYIADINLDDLREYRNRTFWGNAYRRPHKYLKIVSPEVDDPFRRKNGFGEEFKRLKR
jgi:predicted amidohydrolase